MPSRARRPLRRGLPAPARAGAGAKRADRPATARLRRQLEQARALLAEREQLVIELTTHREELAAQNEQLLRAEQELWEARDRFSDLYELAPVSYLTLTRTGLVAGVNRAAVRFLGMEPGVILGKPFAAFVSAGHRPRFRGHLAQCQRRMDTVRVELDLMLQGREAPVQVSSCVSSDGGVYMALADLHERMRSESERRELTIKAEAARAASAAKDEFVAMLSHELRTPLTPVKMAMAELERLCWEREVPAEPLIATIQRNLGYELRLIDDLLDVTRLSHGKLAIERQPVDLHAVVRTALDQIRADADAKALRLSADLAATRHHVRGDPVRLLQIFSNLLRNALKFTPDEGQVEVRTRSDTRNIEVLVHDTGIGISSEDRPRIFGRFVQAGGTPPREGLGLGLAIVQGLVKAHGGWIDVSSPGPGGGSTFVVGLEWIAVQEEAQPPAQTQAAAVKSNGNGAAVAPARPPRRRILFVEDHTDTAQLVAEILTKAGHEVAVADSVASALAHAAEPLDVVVSDIGLPDGSGLELMRRLRARRPVAGIALSGYGTSEDVARSRAAGFQVHLVKPIEVQDLLRAIDELVSPPREGWRPHR